MANKITTAYL